MFNTIFNAVYMRPVIKMVNSLCLMLYFLCSLYETDIKMVNSLLFNTLF